MMKARLWFWFYQAVTWVALLSVTVVLPALLWLRPKFGKWFWLRFRPRPLDFQPRIWFHAVSLGEIKIARALLAELGLEGGRNILLTTATQSGYRFLNERMGQRRVRYLPWDAAFCYRRMFGSYRVPDLVVVETEIWPCLFHFVSSHGSKLVIVNGRVGQKTIRWRQNSLLRGALSKVSRIAARGELDAGRFKAFGVEPERLVLTGNMKFDFKPKSLMPGAFADWLNEAAMLVIFASISTDELPLLVPEVSRLMGDLPQLSVLWVPRHLTDLEKHLRALERLVPERRSLLSEGRPAFLVLDTFGELSACYGAAKLSLVGGSFNQRGGQNFLESLQAGTPAVVGPSTENFKREVAEALKAGCIVRVKRAEGLTGILGGLLRDETALKLMSRNAQKYLAGHLGAIARTGEVLIDLDIFSEEGEAS